MEERTSPFKLGIKYGLILSLLGIIFSLIVYYTGLQDFSDPQNSSNFGLTLVVWIMVFGIIYIALRELRTSNEGYLNTGEGMSTSLYIGLVSGIIGAIWTYVFYTYLAPDIAEILANSVDYDEMEENQAEMTEKMMGFMMNPALLAVMALFMRLIAVAIFGLIASLILKKENTQSY